MRDGLSTRLVARRTFGRRSRMQRYQKWLDDMLLPERHGAVSVLDDDVKVRLRTKASRRDLPSHAGSTFHFPHLHCGLGHGR